MIYSGDDSEFLGNSIPFRFPSCLETLIRVAYEMCPLEDFKLI